MQGAARAVRHGSGACDARSPVRICNPTSEASHRPSCAMGCGVSMLRNGWGHSADDSRWPGTKSSGAETSSPWVMCAWPRDTGCN
jgi:hypothetical protein